MIASTSGTIAATFTVSLSAPSAQPVTVVYATSDGTATAGIDYVAIPATTLTFAPGPDRADRHGHGQLRAGRGAGQELRRQPFQPSRRGDLQPRPGWAWARSSTPGTFPAVSIGAATVIASTSGTTAGDLRRQPVGRLRPAGDRRLRHGRRHGHGGRRLRRHPLHAADLQPGQTEQTVTVTVDPEPAGAAAKTFNVNLSSPSPTGVTISSDLGLRHDPRPQHPAGRLDQLRRRSSPAPAARPRRPSSSPCRRPPTRR